MINLTHFSSLTDLNKFEEKKKELKNGANGGEARVSDGDEAATASDNNDQKMEDATVEVV